jgi:hypothetical protein
MKKALNNDLDKSLNGLLGDMKRGAALTDKKMDDLVIDAIAKTKKDEYKAYDYRKLTCGSCGTQMFADEAIHEVFCVNSRCNYIGFRFKAPVVRLERILEG